MRAVEYSDPGAKSEGEPRIERFMLTSRSCNCLPFSTTQGDKTKSPIPNMDLVLRSSPQNCVVMSSILTITNFGFCTKPASVTLTNAPILTLQFKLAGIPTGWIWGVLASRRTQVGSALRSPRSLRQSDGQMAGRVLVSFQNLYWTTGGSS